MYTTNQEEIGVMEGIALKPKSVSEKITEAIVEMNIMKEQRISRDELMQIIENCSN